VIAWIALRNSRTSHAPHYPELILVEGLPGNCEIKNESLVNLQNDSKTGRWSTCNGNQFAQRGESHYSYQDVFCNTFFRFVSTEYQLRNFV